MVFTVDFTDNGVRRWSKTSNGATATVDETYTPSLFATSSDGLSVLQNQLSRRRDVASTEIEQWRTEFRDSSSDVLRIDVSSIDRVRPVATWIRSASLAGKTRCFNVDFNPQFRYCLETDTDPTPTRPLEICHLDVAETELIELPITELTVNEESVTGPPAALLDDLTTRIEDIDPDVLVVSTAQLIPALFDVAAATDVKFRLGRKPGYTQLAGESTFESYGQVGHSPARYTVPGRVIVDESNTFFYDEAGLKGCLDLVGRSYKPLEELSWASIGNVLTAIQIREAIQRDVLVPWNSWRHEFFKPMSTLHEADRGGFTFDPDVGVHENVHELDFSSLYPNIIVTRNVSPETVRCDCHSNRADVPEIGYSICEERGYLCDVLEPLIEDRDAIKAEIDECEEPTREAELESRSAAIKWILVSCFGYQGFSNAKFGRIECHEAINAYAREILLDAKATLEANGWRILHGIVDSLWVTPRADESQAPLVDVAADITSATGIQLEYERQYDWIAFVPQRNANRGALTKYFGRAMDGEYKYRGIECRQRSTPAFISEAQQELIDVFDETRDPEAVCSRLAQFQTNLLNGEVDPKKLITEIRVSKNPSEYDRRTLTTAALERARGLGLERSAGQTIEYLVADNTKASAERVRLSIEDPTKYDSDYYDQELIRAATSVLSPLGWSEDQIRQQLSDSTNLSLGLF